MRGLALLGLAFWTGTAGAQEAAAPAETAPLGAELRPGLVAVYRALGAAPDAPPLVRVDPKPSGTWGASSPHPRLAPGPFEVTWTGIFLQPESDALRFGAFVGGEAEVTLGGLTVLEGRGEDSWVEGTSPKAWKPGAYRIKVRFRSLPPVPARLQLWWEGKTFSREPLPPWRFKHAADEKPEAARKEEEVAKGRAALGAWGCARCHRSALRAVTDPPPGPLLEPGSRIDRAWLLRWLEDPGKVHGGARMPAVFAPDRAGFVERWIVARFLAPEDPAPPKIEDAEVRNGKAQFLLLGCAACHVAPGLEPEGTPPEPGRTAFAGLRERWTPPALAAFLQDPSSRYPDGRMPRIPIDARAARDVAAYLLGTAARPAVAPPGEPPAPLEIDAVARRLGAGDAAGAARALLKEKRCFACHPGSEPADLPDVPLRTLRAGCLEAAKGPRFSLDPETRRAMTSALEAAARETHPSPFQARQELLGRRGCARCHARDSDLAAPIEGIGGRLGTEVRQHRLPFQRTPRLTHALSKYRRAYLVAAVRDGVSGVRPDWYSYKMPVFGPEAEEIVRALAEADGDPALDPEPPPAPVADPVAYVEGPVLVGFEGYSCITCHIWKRESLTSPDPSAVGPELTTVSGRIRRDWFDRWLEDPARAHPGTPMPSVFRRGQPATIKSAVYGDDPAKQKEAIWDYLSKGKEAVSPRSPPPIAVDPPAPEGPPLVAPIPVSLGGRVLNDSLCILFGSHDLVVYDLGAGVLDNVWVGAQLLRKPRPRGYATSGTAAFPDVDARPAFHLVTAAGREPPRSYRFRGYERLADGVRMRLRVQFASGAVEVVETVRLPRGGSRVLLREIHAAGVPAGGSLELKSRLGSAIRAFPLAPDASLRYELPPARPPPGTAPAAAAGAGRIADAWKVEGSLERPGYRAIAYPRPTTPTGEDRVMPYSLAVDPRGGRLYLASEKMGEVLALRDPHDDGRDARFENFAGGLFQQAYGLVHDGEGLTVLHRGALTRLRDTDGDGAADVFERLAGGSDWMADSRAFGLLRDRSGAYWFNVADNKKPWPGSATALRLRPGDPATYDEPAFGIRQAYGWCLRADGQIFFTDNQGEWVATNKLCLLVPGRFYGYRNAEKKHHFDRPAGKAAVLIPYGWAKSVNGLDVDQSGGKFGPFEGQFFMAEMMYGGGLIRAHVEEVNGELQGACFPFWGKGLLGPLVAAFDPKGRLFVGGMSEGECGSQPDRGALFRVDFTGETPFEIHSIRVRPSGFRLVFTRPIDPASARAAAAFAVEHYRYEYTGAYGSPELDRTPVTVRGVRVSDDARGVDLETDPLVKDRVYLLQAGGVRSPKGEALVHPTGAYTLHEIPAK
jgi:mono/diheme cytochrome c family protein